VRYVGLIVAIYSFSENNLDNFPFMALFVLCLSARHTGDSSPVRQQSHLATRLNPALQDA
jgi:hypothetical protein